MIHVRNVYLQKQFTTLQVRTRPIVFLKETSEYAYQSKLLMWMCLVSAGPYYVEVQLECLFLDTASITIMRDPT